MNIQVQRPSQLSKFIDHWHSGCFTPEHGLIDKTLNQIWQELGLPTRRLADGANIFWALEPPGINNFHLAGWAEYSTDLFVKYKLGKAYWSRELYEKTYKGKRFPKPELEVKEAWLYHLKREKLLKVVPAIGHMKGEEYPKGGLRDQIIVINEIPCQLACTLQPNEVFRGVFDY